MLKFHQSRRILWISKFPPISPFSSMKTLDVARVLLSFLILFNVSSQKGVGIVNNLASGTVISISTSKGSVIVTSTSGASSGIIPNSGNNRRWNQYETALSNTGPLGNPDSVLTSEATTSSTTTTTLPPTTSTVSFSEEEGGGAVPTKKPSSNSRVTSNKTAYHVSFNNNNNVLNNARKYIASYEDLQSRFPDGSPFENNTSINMTVPLGDTAFLRCRVRNLGERSISWIRRRDWHILTTGKTTYTNDERFNVLHSDGTEDWTLQIKFVQKRDNGTYECQVSTGTGIISYFVNLFIAVPEAFILGNGEYHVEQRSNINLVCVIEKSPKPPEFIFWYHNERMINYGNSREVVVRTEPGARTQSRLTIRDAKISDSGNYTCKTAHAEPASIFVYVSQASGLFSGDKMAAIQRRKSAGTSSSSSSADSSSPSASATAGPPTALTAFPAAAVAASLTISSIQLSSSIGSAWCHYTGASRSRSGASRWSHSFNFLFLFITATGGDVVRSIVETLLSLAFLPVPVFLVAAAKLSDWIWGKVSRIGPPQRFQSGCRNEQENYKTRRDYCSPSANNLSPLSRSPREGWGLEIWKKDQLLLEEQQRARQQSHYRWWFLPERYFVIRVRRLVSSSSSSMNKSLPVFLSIAQSLWTAFPSRVSSFPFQAQLGTRIKEGMLGVLWERKGNPLLFLCSSNHFGFRTISHLLIFPPGPLHRKEGVRVFSLKMPKC